MSLAESQQFFYDLCADPNTVKSLKENMRKCLNNHFSNQKDRDFLKQYPATRYQTYRNHVAIGFLGTIGDVFPVIRSLVTTDEWNELLNQFYLKRLTRSPLARHVFDEFSAYLQKYQGPLMERLPYLHELAEYERLDLRLVFAKDVPLPAQWVTDAPDDPLSLIPFMNPHVELRVYDWPVHKICKTYADPKQVQRGNYPLIVYRDPQTMRARFIEGNQIFADLIDRMKPGGASIRDILEDIAAQHNIPETEIGTFMTEGIQTIAHLRQKGIILGMIAKPITPRRD